MLGAGQVRNGALQGPIGASEALECLGLFNPRGPLWSPLDEGFSEAWLLRAG